MEVIVSAIYDMFITFGLPAETSQGIAEGLGAVVSFFVDAFSFIGDLFSSFAA